MQELREHALVIGEVTLTSGATAQYYVDAKRAILLPAGFGALGELLAGQLREREATAVGGLTMGADAVTCAALAGGAQVKGFFVRKEAKRHGLSRRIEGPLLAPDDPLAMNTKSRSRRSVTRRVAGKLYEASLDEDGELRDRLRSVLTDLPAFPTSSIDGWAARGPEPARRSGRAARRARGCMARIRTTGSAERVRVERVPAVRVSVTWSGSEMPIGRSS